VSIEVLLSPDSSGDLFHVGKGGENSGFSTDYLLGLQINQDLLTIKLATFPSKMSGSATLILLELLLGWDEMLAMVIEGGLRGRAYLV
jgi:hypothetical protein